MEIVKYMGICLSNNWETIDLGAVFMRFYLINVLIQNLAVSNFHAVRHWTEFLDNNAWNPFFGPLKYLTITGATGIRERDFTCLS